MSLTARRRPASGPDCALATGIWRRSRKAFRGPRVSGMVRFPDTVHKHCSMPEFLQPALTIFIDCETLRSYIALAQSRTCLWVSADPRMVRATGKVTGANPSSRSSGQPPDRGHLEATTVRAFLVSAGRPKTGVTEEAHLHCRQCGWSPSKPRQTKRTEAGQGLVHRRETAVHGSGV